MPPLSDRYFLDTGYVIARFNRRDQYHERAKQLAGTLAAAARAGTPQAVVAHLGDQFYHGLRVHRLGLGPEPLRLRSLTADRLANAIEIATEDPAFAMRAKEVSAQLAESDGTTAAAEIIERRVKREASHE